MPSTFFFSHLVVHSLNIGFNSGPEAVCGTEILCGTQSESKSDELGKLKSELTVAKCMEDPAKSKGLM